MELTSVQTELLKVLFYSPRPWSGPELTKQLEAHRTPQGVHQTAASLVTRGLVAKNRQTNSPVRYTLTDAGRREVQRSYVGGR